MKHFKIITFLLALFLIFPAASVPVSAAGDGFETATPIEFDTEYNGSITSTNKTDFYVFTLPSAGYININVIAYIAESSYYIYDENYSTIWYSTSQSADSSTGQLNKNIGLRFTKGTYYFQVKEYSAKTGDYNFKLSFSSANESFPEPQGGMNNSMAEATPISLDTEYYGQIARNDTKDFYKFDLPSSGMLNWRLTSTIYSGNYYLYDSNANLIYKVNGGLASNATGEYNLDLYIHLTSGTYYLYLSYYNNYTGTYKFKITSESANESFPETIGGVNNSFAAASPISFGTTYHGQIAVNDSKDFYKFDVSTAGIINLQLTSQMKWGSYYIFDSDGNAVCRWTGKSANSTTGEYNLDSEISLNPGTYYFVVECHNSYTGTYYFRINKANPFKDVSKDAYYYDAVMWAVANNITTGTKPDLFSPNANCTRAQVVTFLWRAAGSPEPTTNINTFNDVSSTAYYYKAVLWAVENNITTGTKPGVFSPNTNCSRAQVVTFLWRYEGNPSTSLTSNPFKDVTEDKYYYNAVLWAVENNITTGTKPDLFSPNANCTRAQVVTFLYRDIA